MSAPELKEEGHLSQTPAKDDVKQASQTFKENYKA
jgi:hypothetical protein